MCCVDASQKLFGTRNKRMNYILLQTPFIPHPFINFFFCSYRWLSIRYYYVIVNNNTVFRQLTQCAHIHSPMAGVCVCCEFYCVNETSIGGLFLICSQKCNGNVAYLDKIESGTNMDPITWEHISVSKYLKNRVVLRAPVSHNIT